MFKMEEWSKILLQVSPILLDITGRDSVLFFSPEGSSTNINFNLHRKSLNIDSTDVLIFYCTNFTVVEHLLKWNTFHVLAP